MIQKTFEVRNLLGLHARAAARLVRLTSQFESSISLEREEGGSRADGKSILGLLMLAASAGTRLVVRIEGVDENEAEEAVRRLFDDRFGEES